VEGPRSSQTAGEVRRLSATAHKGPLTFEAGKQFIRWGKTDIVTPTDRFAPRDYLTVVDNDFLRCHRRSVELRKRLQHDRGRLVAAIDAQPDSSRRPALGGSPPQASVPVVVRDVRAHFQEGHRWAFDGIMSAQLNSRFVLPGLQ
jgi:hypothetical protein